MYLKAQAQFPLDVQVNVAPPYPLRLSDYTDISSQIFINVNNTSGQSYDITFLGTLTNNSRGIRIETDPNSRTSSCITISPGMNTLSGADLEGVFDPDRLRLSGITASQIRGDQALPEGDYQLCLRAFSCQTRGLALSPPPELMMGCYNIPNAYVDPPVIINPECGAIISADATSITFNWLFTPPANGIGNTEFIFRLVEIDPPGRNPFNAMQSATAPYLVDERGLFSNNFNLLIDSDVMLEIGKSYVYQVIAIDPSEEIAFRNNGASEVCYFTYGSTSGGEPFAFHAAYPKNGDYIPFDIFPFITKFTPYDDYFLFTGDFTLKENRGGSFSTIDTKPARNRWPRGPLIEQRDLGFSDMTEEQSQNLPVYKNPADWTINLGRGKVYAWNFNGSMEYRNGAVLNGASEENTFTRGMSPAILESPPTGSTQAPGNITLSWNSAEKPEALVPKFDIAQYSGGSPVNLFSSTVDEHWVLEVSPESTFDSIYFTANNRINDLVLNGVSDSTEIINALYKQIQRDTAFTEEGIYYWRLKWLKTPGDLNSQAYSISPVWNFTIGTTDSTTRETTPEPPAGCISECLDAEITDTTAVAITNGSTLRMGKFSLKITSVNSTGSDQYSGDGEISIPFLNNVKVSVAFTNIKANAEGRIFDGKAKAKDDLPHITTDSISTIINGVPTGIPDFSEAESDALEEVFETGERLVSLLGSTRPMGMPLGLDTEIDDYRFVIGITEMNFNPRKADITAVARVDIPALGNKLPAFGARGLCITPSGFGDEYALYLARDHEIATAGDFSFVFNGTMDGDTTKASYIEFDCTGFKCARLSGTASIPSDKLIAMNEDKTVNEGEQVKGTFAFKGCRGNNYMGSIEFSAFQVKGMKGWGFKPIVAYLDWSDLENPPGFTFPENYDFSGADNPRQVNTWKGFYLKELALHAPKEFDDDIIGDVEANVQNIIIDETGFTGSVSVRNLIDYDDGEIEGWAFSLDSIAFGIVQNTNISGGFRGKLGTPIFDEDDYLHYSTALSFVDDTLAYNFRVFVKDTLNMTAWVAKVNLNPDSQILFETGSATNTKLSMDLSGDMSIEGDLGIPELSLPGIEFQGLHLSTEDQFRIQHFGFTSPQKSAAGFPLNINDIGFSGGFTNPAVDFDLALTLSEAGFHAEAGLQIIGRVETDADDRIRFAYDRTRLDAISIDQTMDGGIRIAGALQFYEEDPVYGNGMKGNVAVTLPMDMAVNVGVQFGTVRRTKTARFNTENYFSYWYVDGSLRIPQGTVPLFPGFELRGFGGGAYHHMRLTTPPQTIVTGAEGETGRGSGAVYQPYFPTVLGLKASVVMAMAEPKTFNMDVGIEAEFAGYGLASIIIRGDGYVMAGFDEREDAKVTANIEMGYINDGEGGKRVYGNFDIFVKVDPILTGAGEDNLFVRAEFLVDNDTWHFYMGKQPETQRAGLDLNVAVIRAQIMTYLMVGHGIPADLPPLPVEVRNLLYGEQQASVDGSVNPGTLNREVPAHLNNKYENGTGFALGAHFYFGADMDFAIFYAKLDLWLGFDMNISRNESRVCYETGLSPGINGWYGKGRMYAAIRGELGVQVNLFFIKGRFPIIELGAAVSLEGGMPKPVWITGRAGLSYRILGGLVKGYCNFKVEAGEKCTYTDPNPFSDIEFISGFVPDNGDTDISVFQKPQVAFALPVGEMMELPAGLEDEPEKVRVFFPFVERATLRDLKNNQDVPGSYYMNPENVSGTFQQAGALEAQTRHQFEVSVKAREYFPNGTHALVRNNGNIWSETKSATFTTGDRPDEIAEEQVAYTYPFDRQAYFLKNETDRGRGMLKYVDVDQHYLFEEEDEEGQRYNFFARYIQLESEEELIGDITLGSGKLYFQMPTSLENSKVYGVQIIKEKIVERSQSDQLRDRLALEGNNGINPAIATTITRAFTLRNAGTAELSLSKAKLLPTEIDRPREKILYKFHFRTSQFNSLQAKLGSVSLTADYKYLGGSLFEHVQLRGKMEEPFDEFEVNGYYKNGTKILDPLLNFLDLQSANNYYNTARYYLYDLYSDLERLNGRPSRSSMTGRYEVNFGPLQSTRRGYSIFNVTPFKTISLATITDIGRPLADWELDRAAGIGAYGNQASAGSTSNSPGVGNNNLSNNIIANTGISSGINGQFSNVFSLGGNFSMNNSNVSTATQDFGLNFQTSLYVKLDAMNFQSQVSRWLARDLVGFGLFGSQNTNGYFLNRDNPALYRKATQFIALPISYFSLRNGAYRYKITYKYPGSFLGSNITRSFNINYHDESLR
ncbi:hypothetical protein GCM10011506_24440 [Marivirga lumbricoides]|uniref:Secretion system C-terminal sorting domain-containing protein n=1 Tax=Marivirga lumbricoides TaxID=1046115 RepID=A0ABQ1MBX6_9BACT|nr:hypothetical protein GCM10011506_24440 [Marivirga lumbricoides]